MIQFDDLKLASMDFLCDVKEGERLTHLTVFVNTNMIRFDGNVRALSWQTTPGGIYYKRSIVKEALGTDDPAEVGEMMSSMDGLFEVGEKLKGKGYKLFPDEGSIRFAQGDDSQAWGNEDTELVLTEGKQNYFANAKEFRENNLTALAPEWSPSWFEGMDKPIKVKEGGKETETEVISYVREHLEVVSDWNAEGLKHSKLLLLVPHG